MSLLDDLAATILNRLPVVLHLETEALEAAHDVLALLHEKADEEGWYCGRFGRFDLAADECKNHQSYYSCGLRHVIDLGDTV